MAAVVWLVASAGLCAAGPVPDLGQAGTFVILGLDGGTVTINSATSIIGDVGYSRLVTSTTNQKVDLFTGDAYVHSLVTNFQYTAATYVPSSGIHYGSSDPAVDARLDNANAAALAASAAAAAMTTTVNLGALGDNDSRTVNSTGDVNVVAIASLNYKSDSLTLVGRPGHDDFFIINVASDFSFDQSDIILTNVSTGHVLFNFPNASNIDLNKSNSALAGTFLAPTSSIIYHNPATFNGALIGLNLDLHSDFNITHNEFVPEPATLGLLAAGVVAALVRRRRVR